MWRQENFNRMVLNHIRKSFVWRMCWCTASYIRMSWSLPSQQNFIEERPNGPMSVELLLSSRNAIKVAKAVFVPFCINLLITLYESLFKALFCLEIYNNFVLIKIFFWNILSYFEIGILKTFFFWVEIGQILPNSYQKRPQLP